MYATRKKAREYRNEWHAKNLNRDRGYVLKYKFGISVAEYDALLERQGGCCAICRSPRPSKSDRLTHFHIDHDHACCPGKRACGKCVRGLLCNRCNMRLGVLENDPQWRTAAEGYLTRERP